MALNITGDASADSLLTDDPFALLIGLLLDQQVPMETAFAGPATIRDRLGLERRPDGGEMLRRPLATQAESHPGGAVAPARARQPELRTTSCG